MRRTICVLLSMMLALSCARASAEAFPTDFILGVDVSELIAQEKSGAKYYDAEGNAADALKLLSDYGAGHIRLRVWNDPFDVEGNGYGGGNIDAKAAAKLSARAAKLGMKSLIDFHYSDFWADPSRQLAPKAWTGMSAEEKAAALYDFTRQALSLILDEGGDVDMVQVGNETNYGMAGEDDTDTVAMLISEGCRAVKDVAAERGVEIMTCVHLTDITRTGRIDEVLAALSKARTDVDAVGLSYYAYWAGAPDVLARAVETVRRHGKAAFVAETAWPFTLEDGDGWSNVVGEVPEFYPVSPEGQARAFCDACRTAANAGANGAFYWGGIWTPVGGDAEANRVLWERCGSGWATRCASEYDPDHVAQDYGGCAWDNQAMFDFGGKALPVLDAMKSMAGGAIPEGMEPATYETEAPEEEGENLVKNPGFEDGDRSMWVAESATDDIPFDYQDFANDAHGGTVAFHYWSRQDMDFSVSQTLTGLEPGIYRVACFSQGGDMKDAALTLFAEADGVISETDFMNTTWANWQNPVIDAVRVEGGELTVGARIRCAAQGWGTLDDFSVVKVGE